MRIILVFFLTVVCLGTISASGYAQEFEHNAAGIYLAPTLYGYSRGSEYQISTSGGGLDVGAYYSRFFTPRWSARIEVRLGARALEDAVSVADPYGDYWALVRISEDQVQFPLILERCDRIMIDDHEMRISVGGGATVTYVISQDLLWPGGEATVFTPADSYGRVGVVADGGVTFQVVQKTSVFLRLRLDIDLWTFAEPDDADVVRRYWSTGFYAGYEYGF